LIFNDFDIVASANNLPSVLKISLCSWCRRNRWDSSRVITNGFHISTGQKITVLSADINLSWVGWSSHNKVTRQILGIAVVQRSLESDSV
jgi:hypothetical protein